MNIFDIIKYSNTNLSNDNELLPLPEELMELYWWKVTGLDPDAYGYTHGYRCRSAGGWYRGAHRRGKESYSKLFIEALKEYSARDEE